MNTERNRDLLREIRNYVQGEATQRGIERYLGQTMQALGTCLDAIDIYKDEIDRLREAVKSMDEDRDWRGVI